MQLDWNASGRITVQRSGRGPRMSVGIERAQLRAALVHPERGPSMPITLFDVQQMQNDGRHTITRTEERGRYRCETIRHSGGGVIHAEIEALTPEAREVLEWAADGIPSMPGGFGALAGAVAKMGAAAASMADQMRSLEAVMHEREWSLGDAMGRGMSAGMAAPEGPNRAERRRAKHAGKKPKPDMKARQQQRGW